MSNTNHTKATFGKRASLVTGSKPMQNTQIGVTESGILIRVFNVSETKVVGHTRIDFERKRRKDSYKELNKMLEKVDGFVSKR